WTATASAPVPGSLSGQVLGFSSQVTIPTGPLATGVFAQLNGQASGDARWDPVASAHGGAIAVRAACSSAALSISGSVTANGAVTVDLLLSPPTGGATAGVVVLEAERLLLGGASASMSVDVGADGSVELASAGGTAHVAVAVPASGVVVRVALYASASAGTGSVWSLATASVSAEFVPGRAVVEPFAPSPSAAGLSATLLGPDRWQLELAGPAGTAPLLTVFGFAATNVPVAPGLVQLVSVDTVLPGGVFVFDLPALPAGFALYAQGLVHGGPGSLLASNSVRVRWF
ncbi:MAG: hypothetical protein KAI24_07965, partial [Planctomycetes bacterium]|nr:hypothetical protein [Planctomycetota bacterium]